MPEGGEKRAGKEGYGEINRRIETEEAEDGTGSFDSGGERMEITQERMQDSRRHNKQRNRKKKKKDLRNKGQY